MLNYIQNTNDYFPSNYFGEEFHKNVLNKANYTADQIKDCNTRIRALRQPYFEYKTAFLKAKVDIDKIEKTHHFHTKLLKALGYEGDKTEYDDLFLINADKKQVIPVRHKLYRGEQPHLFIMEMKAMIQINQETVVEGLFDQQYHSSQWKNVFKFKENGVSLSPSIINRAVSELFQLKHGQSPKFILMLAGNMIFLIEKERWFEGAYLQFDLEKLFEESALSSQINYLSLLFALIGKPHLAPDADAVLMETLGEEAYKTAAGVTDTLKDGVIHVVEAIANEAIWYLKRNQLWNETDKVPNLPTFDANDKSVAQTLRDEALIMAYRLLFLFYAESRPTLSILPMNDADYLNGYSLEKLRDLELVPLESQRTRDGYFFHASFQRLFDLLENGFNANGESKTFAIRRIDSPIFKQAELSILQHIEIRNHVWQNIIQELSLTTVTNGKRKRKERISYANLSIEQLGSVYENLLAFRGFFAETDLCEVHKKGKPEEGTFLVSWGRMDDFKADEILRNESYEPIKIPKGQFLYRLSGRDRQKSASYYTPKVLTETTVHYTLKPILERPELRANDLLEFKILEPAMGAANFHAEVIHQLAEAYLERKQAEQKRQINPNDYVTERQKVKAYIATNNVYGVDLNPTAVEFGKLALWLNVIHENMEVPFFGYRVTAGNAVVGAWLKVYEKKAFIAEPKSKSSQQFKTKKWWETAPKMLPFENGKINRKPTEIYHFLLPDYNMVASANIALLKTDYKDEAKKVQDWRKQFCQPIRQTDFQRLQRVCETIDTLLEEHYVFQQEVNALTKNDYHVWGSEPITETQKQLSYAEKQRFADLRKRPNAPFAMIQNIMNYWTALWFWEVQEAEQLPTYNDFLKDIETILSAEMKQKIAEIPTDLFGKPLPQDLFSSQTILKESRNVEKKNLVDKLIQETADAAASNVFYKSKRINLVQQYAKNQRFFHYQLEFLEVFKERGGFDIIVGNPPWVKLQFDEKGIISENFPEVMIRKTSSSQVRKKLSTYFEKTTNLKTTYLAEYSDTESSATFLNAMQNFPLLKGQQTNLYKCVLENGFNLIAKQGMMGLVHPDGIYDDPKGQPLRKAIYKRLKYHFQFQNAFNLFAEVAHREKYSSNIYSGNIGKVGFYNINNLFHPSTINGCFVNKNEQATPDGIKTFSESEDKFVWNSKPHFDRKIFFTETELSVLAKTFEDSEDWETAKLVSVHAQQIISVLEKLSLFSSKVGDFNNMTSEGWHETNAQNKGIIQRETKYPNLDNFEMIYSGPHFYVGNPIYKTPREKCVEKADYDVIDLMEMDENYIARTNYIPAENLEDFENRIDGLEIIKYQTDGKPIYDNWINYYKIVWSKMLNQAGERTLQSALVYPKISHIDACNSVIFSNEKRLIEFLGLTQSIPLDFFIKTTGKATLRGNITNFLPLGISETYYKRIAIRTLLLNCLTRPYADLWERHFESDFIHEKWSIEDNRLKDFSSLTEKWCWDIPLRNYFERRQALIEIDVLSAMALGLTLEELKLIYEVQFPVLQQNEADTWYDTTGNIVFTCSKGLTGVGLGRKEWNEVKDYKSGETYTHTITKSELYQGKEVVYYAPFRKCDRVGDYEKAWKFFERLTVDG
jgi:hypothetical protein